MEPLDQRSGDVGVGRDAVVWKKSEMDGWIGGGGKKGLERTSKAQTRPIPSQTTPFDYVRANRRAPDAYVGLNSVGDPIHLHGPRTAGRSSGRASRKRRRG